MSNHDHSKTKQDGFLIIACSEIVAALDIVQLSKSDFNRSVRVAAICYCYRISAVSSYE